MDFKHAVALALVLAAAGAHAQDLVTGKLQSWSRTVGTDRQPGRAHDGAGPRAPLYFWMVFSGGEEALQRMNELGALPIRHRWSVAVGGDVAVEPADDTYVERRSIALSVGTGDKAVLGALATQLQAAQAFTWRTWSRKDSLSPGYWKVDVLYDDDRDTPVRCEIAGKLKPCSFTLLIK